MKDEKEGDRAFTIPAEVPSNFSAVLPATVISLTHTKCLLSYMVDRSYYHLHTYLIMTGTARRQITAQIIIRKGFGSVVRQCYQ